MDKSNAKPYAPKMYIEKDAPPLSLSCRVCSYLFREMHEQKQLIIHADERAC